ncbi:MAG: hypothetical protein IJF75_07085 [Clostridia bacterium]|nr:hypothetical protein [Clostridia bacterium]
MEFLKNELLENVMDNYYQTFAKTLNTCDFVPEKYCNKINKYIFNDMKRSFKQAEKEYKRYRRKEFWAKFKFKFGGFKAETTARLNNLDDKLTYLLKFFVSDNANNDGELNEKAESKNKN